MQTASQQPQQQPSKPRTYDMREAAAYLNSGRTRLLRWLREHKYVYDDRDGSILPARQYVDAGYLVADIHQVPLGNTGMIVLRANTRVTQKGLLWLQKKIEQERNACTQTSKY